VPAPATPTTPWSRREGRLSLTDRWAIALTAVRTRLASSRQAHPPPIELDPRALDSITPPQDNCSRATLAWAAKVQPAWLLQHALRTYAWARLLALGGGHTHDAALLCAASLLHDLGLTPSAAEPGDGCFAVRGAKAAGQFLVRNGASPEHAHRVACAIALHLDMHVGPEHGIEAHLLNAAAALDVVGRRSRELAPALKQAVLARHPRLGMKAALCACMRREAGNAASTRMGLYVGRFGFLDLIEKAPFDE
jgi:HD domain